MRFEIVKVTPRMAEAFLGKNEVNRTLRPTVVDTYANAIRRGEWKLTHQGIAFDKKGSLIDGQHRLNAILLAGAPVALAVIKDVDPDAYQVVDGNLRRSPSDTLGVTTGEAAIVSMVCKLDNPDMRGRVTTLQLVPYLAAFGPYIKDLLDYCQTTSKAWSSAAVRTAAILKIADGEDRDYVKTVYAALQRRDFDSMPPIAKALFNQYLDGVARAGNDMFARSLSVFTKDKSRLPKIQIGSTEPSLKYARGVIRDVMEGREKARKATKAVKPKRETVAA